jgi:DNA-binding MarR family transcriptional regulator
MRHDDGGAVAQAAEVSAPHAAAHPPLDETALGHLVGYRLARADVPARRAFMRHVGTPLKLRPVEFSLLVLLLANGSASAKQVGQSLDLPPPQVTMLVDRLVERGFVQRRRSARDARALELTLTAAGRELAQRAHRISLTMEAPLLQALSPAERAMLFELLAKLARG